MNMYDEKRETRAACGYELQRSWESGRYNRETSPSVFPTKSGPDPV